MHWLYKVKSNYIYNVLAIAYRLCMPNQAMLVYITTYSVIRYNEGLLMSNDDKEIIMSTIEGVEDVRFIVLVMKSSYRTYATPYIIWYCDIINGI